MRSNLTKDKKNEFVEILFLKRFDEKIKSRSVKNTKAFAEITKPAVVNLVFLSIDVETRKMSFRPSSSTTENTTARIGEMIQNDRRVTVGEIPSELGLSYGSVQHIVSDVLRYSKTVL
ncbi:hypothetical protein TNCV_3585461 [Trichonephila clavipes]|nr:hypothetical protein TNCV_3585461 [Trichonephila clavipes]